MTVDAVVLAGGQERGELREMAGVEHRALIVLRGKLMGEVVLSALREAQTIERIALVGPQAVRDAMAGDLFDVWAQSGDSFTGNLKMGIEALQAQGKVLAITADIPFLSPEVVDRYISDALAQEAAAVYPIIPMEEHQRKFPGTKRTYARLREGRFSGGNGVLVDAAFILSQYALIDRLFDYRKSPLKLAGIFGLDFIWGVITGRLTLAQAEARAQKILGVKVVAAICRDPEMGFDVDKVSDLEWVRRKLGEV